MFHDKTWQWMDRHPSILIHLPSFNDNLDQRGGIQRWQGQWNMKQEHNGRAPWAVHKELWRWEGNNDILHQTTATSIKLQTKRPQSFWSLGLSIDREEEWLLRKFKMHRKVSQTMCPVKEEKKSNPLKLN